MNAQCIWNNHFHLKVTLNMIELFSLSVNLLCITTTYKMMAYVYYIYNRLQSRVLHSLIINMI
ncbi:hypothetical protein Hanom_Chr02g00156221 [Helianthus anomalus]